MIKDPSQSVSRCQAVMRSRWFMPLFCLGLGVVVLVASWLGGQLGTGLYGLVVMTAFGIVLLLLGGRSETIRGLTTGRDERFAQIDLKATAAAGLALIITVIVAWLVQTARGHSGHPLTGSPRSAGWPTWLPSRPSAGAADPCRPVTLSAEQLLI